MLFLLVLIGATATSAGIWRSAGRHAWARNGLGIAFVVAGVAHFATPTPFEQHLPAWVPAPGALVAITGAIEVAFGVGLTRWTARQRHVGVVVAAYLVAVFPANAYVAVAGVDVDGQPGGIYPWVRLPLQALFVAWALWSTRPSETESVGTDATSVSAGGSAPRVLAPAWRSVSLPWVPGRARAATGDRVVMASRLELRRYRDVPGFLVAALRLRREFRRAPGGVGLALRAEPQRRTFWTLSVWTDAAAIGSYVATPKHREVTERFGSVMAGSGFVTWTDSSADRPSWGTATSRLAATSESDRNPASDVGSPP